MPFLSHLFVPNSAKTYTREDTYKRQLRNPNISGNRCGYSAGDHNLITFSEFYLSMAVISERNKFIAAYINDGGVLGMSGLPIERSARRRLTKAEKRAETYRTEKPVTNQHFDRLLERIQELYYHPSRFRSLFRLRYERNLVKRDKLPRGEILKVAVDLLSCMVITTNFAHDEMPCVKNRFNPESVPTVRYYADILKHAKGYKPERVARAYRLLLSIGLVHQKLRISENKGVIRSKAALKWLNSELFTQLNAASQFSTIKANAIKKWGEFLDGHLLRKTTEKLSTHRYRANMTDKLPKKKTKHESQPNNVSDPPTAPPKGTGLRSIRELLASNNLNLKIN